MSRFDHLFSPLLLGRITLSNRAVMAPMTRSRALGGVPNALMATYYAQRASAGLIITEGTSPSPHGLGYTRIPGLFSEAQVVGWRLVTDAVHAAGGHIFVQLMHTGRVGHPLNLPEGAEILAPSAVMLEGNMHTDAEGPQPHPVPRALTEAEIASTIAEFVQASRNAIAAGFDGVELHGANGYLIEQFLHPNTNRREDGWGGSPEARNRFALTVARQVAEAIGADRVGIRLSPYGAVNGTGPFAGVDEQFAELAAGLGALKLAYVHVVDHASMGAPPVSPVVKQAIRERFGGVIILSGGYDAARAEADLAAGLGELVAFGRPFLANPDLLHRFLEGAPLNAPRFDRFYTPGAEGYTDYPTLGAASAAEVG